MKTAIEEVKAVSQQRFVPIVIAPPQWMMHEYIQATSKGHFLYCRCQEYKNQFHPHKLSGGLIIFISFSLPTCKYLSIVLLFS